MAQQKDSAASQSRKFNVCVISQVPETSAAVLEALRRDQQVSARVLNKPFDRVNGSVAEVLADNSAIIVDLQSTGDETLPALRDMLAQRKNKSKILALSDGEISLTEARRYRMLGVDDVLPVPFAPDDLAQVIARFRDAEHPESAVPPGAVIGVAHSSGGVGATTLAVNLALALLDRRGVLTKKPRRRVALVDLNLQFGTIAQYLDLSDDSGMMALVASGRVPDLVALDAITSKHVSGLDVITAPDKPVPLDALGAEQVEALIDRLRDTHDFTVLDLPLQLVTWLEPALKELDQLMLVANLTVPSVLGAQRLMEIYAEDRLDLPIEIVMNREKPPVFSSRLVTDAQQALNRKISFWVPEDTSAARDAINRGQPLIDAHPRSQASKAIRKIAENAAKSLASAGGERTSRSR